MLEEGTAAPAPAEGFRNHLHPCMWLPSSAPSCSTLLFIEDIIEPCWHLPEVRTWTVSRSQARVTSAQTQKPRYVWTTLVVTKLNSDPAANTYKSCSCVREYVSLAAINQLLTFTECSLNKAHFLTFHPNCAMLMNRSLCYCSDLTNVFMSKCHANVLSQLLFVLLLNGFYWRSCFLFRCRKCAAACDTWMQHCNLESFLTHSQCISACFCFCRKALWRLQLRGMQRLL